MTGELTPQMAYELGQERERLDLIAWFEQGDGWEDIIELIKEGAHEGMATS